MTFEPKEFLLRFSKDITRIDNFVSNVTGSVIWLKLDSGSISVEHAKNLFYTKYSEEKELLTLFFENWLDIFEPIQKNINIMKNLKQNGYKVFALSNFIKEAYEFVIKKFDFFSLFDGQVISWKEKVIKPDMEIYKIILDRYNLPSRKCVFLDDHSSFLVSAQQLGMYTVLISKDTDLQAELRNLNIKI